MRKVLYSAISLVAAVAFAAPALAAAPQHHGYRHVRDHHVYRHTARYYRDRTHVTVRPRYRDYGGDYAYAPPAEPHNGAREVAPVAGVAAGTTIGVGVAEGWGSAAATAALPTTVAGAAAVGGVAGLATMPVVDAMLEPCRGFAALFDLSRDECVDGHYVGPPSHNLVPWNRQGS